MKRVWFIGIVLFFLAACNNDSETKTPPVDSTTKETGKRQDSSSRMVYNFTDSILQKKIVDTLMQLSFIKETNAYIDSISNHTQRLSFITDTAGSAISVMAGYNGAERFETYYHFRIDPDTFAISVLNEASGNFIPAAEYKKMTKEPD